MKILLSDRILLTLFFFHSTSISVRFHMFTCRKKEIICAVLWMKKIKLNYWNTIIRLVNNLGIVNLLSNAALPHSNDLAHIYVLRCVNKQWTTRVLDLIIINCVANYKQFAFVSLHLIWCSDLICRWLTRFRTSSNASHDSAVKFCSRKFKMGRRIFEFRSSVSRCFTIDSIGTELCRLHDSL